MTVRPLGAYIGRFAPSPTGPLHLGSLVAALASYLDARSHSGRWLVRIEDVDATRCKAEWVTDILRTLEIFGLEWDGEVVTQTSRTARYQHALEKLRAKGLVYACTCSRKEIGDSAIHGIDGPVYRGTCRHKQNENAGHAALRVITNDLPIAFTDRLQGKIVQSIEREIGDFVLLRKEAIFAYQLAVVVDDALQGVTHVVRGADLLDSTARQIYLQQLLVYTQPAYLHIPGAVNELGQKLSKQTLAEAVNSGSVQATLLAALRFLGQDISSASRDMAIGDLLVQAVLQWRPDAIPKRRAADAGRVLSA